MLLKIYSKGPLRLSTNDLRPPTYGVMVVADTLASNRRQAISIHHADLTEGEH